MENKPLSQQVIEDNDAAVEEIVLTDDELKAAIKEGKRKKLFKEKNKEYWEAKEKIK